MKSISNHSRSFLLISMLCMTNLVLAQTQLGSDIDGEVAGDQLGWDESVSLSRDGSRLAVGSRSNSNGGENAGHVRVFEFAGEDWVQVGNDIQGEAAGDSFGIAVSLSSSGNRVAVGASKNDGNGDRAGHVRVFQWSGSDWVQLGADIDGEVAGDGSGISLSLSSDGNRVAIGALWNGSRIAQASKVQASPRNHEHLSVNSPYSGHVRVFEWSGADWEQLGADIDGEAEEDFSGWVSLSADGNYVAVGAEYNDGNGTDSGHVRVYQWSGTDWVQRGSDIDGEAAGDNSGNAVSISADGHRVAIGAQANDGNGKWSGHVRVYEWSGADWIQKGSDLEGDAIDDYFGQTLSLSSDGNRLAVGAGSHDGNGNSSGLARIFYWAGTDWKQLGDDIYGEEAGDYALAVSLSADGNRLAFGAPWHDNSIGHVRVFDLSMLSTFNINPGLNDAWYYPQTDGQGFFITVYPDLGAMSLGWFTYDTELPSLDATANLGDAGHRWITAVGPYLGDKAILDIELTSGGLFDTSTEVTRTDPPGTDGTITVIFKDCESGSVEYDIPSINQTGVVPIQRVANDNIVLCQVLAEEP